MVKVKEDLTGRTFGRLKVLKQVEDYVAPDGRHIDQWLCECNCIENNKIIVIGKSLKSGNTKSCGCLKRESVSQIGQNNKKNNDYVLHLMDEYGEYGIGYCTNTNKEFYFDMDDYEKISKHTWIESVDHSGYHFLRSSSAKNDIYISMHCIITSRKYCDHIDRNPFNNRKINLRSATYAENARNRTKPKNNRSGFIGVFWEKRGNQWCAQITFTGYKKHLGYFNNKTDAVRARLKAEKEYFEEFAPQKHLFKEYGINEEGEEI